MDTLHTFMPTMDGPANMKIATCKHDAGQTEEVFIEEDDSKDTEPTEDADAQHVHGTLPIDLPAEFLIGVREDDAQDPACSTSF